MGGKSRSIGRSIGDSLVALRLWQIRRSASLFALLDRIGPTAWFQRSVRSFPPARFVFDRVMGYRRAFDSLAEAQAMAARFTTAGDHSHDKAFLHVSRTRVARPSDYPVLFHLDRLAPNLTYLFDLGGSVGNLFYCFSKYLSLRPDLRWTVYDLPEMLEIGRKKAVAEGEQRLRFTGDLGEASGADVLLASGSLHYFSQSLPQMVGRMPAPPRHVIVNRTPITSCKPIATVQDGPTDRVACRLIPREAVIEEMADLGYVLIDSWLVPELSVIVPLYPEYSVSSYSGLYFRLDHGRRASLPGSRIGESRMS